jgi:hypothetical protein
VGVRTPFGEQRYEIGPDGRSSTMVTDIGPEGQALVGRAVGLGMTDSARMQVPNQINGLAQALANRVGGRFGMAPEQGMQLSSQSPTPQAPQKPAPRSDMPAASVGGNRPPNAPAMPPQTGPGMSGGHFGAIRDALRNQRMQ